MSASSQISPFSCATSSKYLKSFELLNLALRCPAGRAARLGPFASCAGALRRVLHVVAPAPAVADETAATDTPRLCAQVVHTRARLPFFAPWRTLRSRARSPHPCRASWRRSLWRRLMRRTTRLVRTCLRGLWVDHFCARLRRTRCGRPLGGIRLRKRASRAFRLLLGSACASRLALSLAHGGFHTVSDATINTGTLLYHRSML